MACDDWMTIRILEAPAKASETICDSPPLTTLKNVTIYITQGHWGKGIRLACDDWMTIRIPEAPSRPQEKWA